MGKGKKGIPEAKPQTEEVKEEIPQVVVEPLKPVVPQKTPEEKAKEKLAKETTKQEEKAKETEKRAQELMKLPRESLSAGQKAWLSRSGYIEKATKTSDKTLKTFSVTKKEIVQYVYEVQAYSKKEAIEAAGKLMLHEPLNGEVKDEKWSAIVKASVPVVSEESEVAP